MIDGNDLATLRVSGPDRALDELEKTLSLDCSAQWKKGEKDRDAELGRKTKTRNTDTQ